MTSPDPLTPASGDEQLIEVARTAFFAERDGFNFQENATLRVIAAVRPLIEAEAAAKWAAIAREEMLGLSADLTAKAQEVMRTACLQTAEAVRVECNAHAARAVAEVRAEERARIADAIEAEADIHDAHRAAYEHAARIARGEKP